MVHSELKVVHSLIPKFVATDETDAPAQDKHSVERSSLDVGLGLVFCKETAESLKIKTLTLKK